MPGQGSEGQGPGLSNKHNGQHSRRERAKSTLGGLLPLTPSWPVHCSRSSAEPPLPTPGDTGGYWGMLMRGLQEGEE